MRVQEFIILMASLNGFAILIVVFFKRKDILSFFFPHKWSEVEILESDNACSSWLQKKTSDLTFHFNGMDYNMFHKEDLTPKYTTFTSVKDGIQVKERVEIPQKKRKFPIYRSGRVSKFLYVEGNPDPIDLREVSVAESKSLKHVLSRGDIEGLFADDYGFFGNINLKDVLLFGGIILIIFLMLK